MKTLSTRRQVGHANPTPIPWNKLPLWTMIHIYVIAMNTSMAQSNLAPGQLKAANNARMFAEQLNGGLVKYHPASCMYQQGGGTCMIESGREGFRFRFLGGSPGWETLRVPPTVETELFIGIDGSKAVIYNGSLR